MWEYRFLLTFVSPNMDRFYDSVFIWKTTCQRIPVSLRILIIVNREIYVPQMSYSHTLYAEVCRADKTPYSKYITPWMSIIQLDWRSGVVVVTTIQLESVDSEPMFCICSSHSREASEVLDDKRLRRLPQMWMRLSTIFLFTRFVEIIHYHDSFTKNHQLINLGWQSAALKTHSHS